VLDRATGKPILPIPEVKVPQSKEANTWPTQPIPQGGAGQLVKHTVDPGPWAGYTAPDGKPPVIGSNTPYPPIDSSHYTISSRPGLNQWQHNSYDPKTGNLYVQALYRIYIQTALPAQEVLPNLSYQNGVFGAGWVLGATAGTPAATANTTRLVAFNPAKNKVSWVTEYENNPTTPNALGAFSGIVTTDSGVLFVSRVNGYLEAYDSGTGKLLWTSPKLVAQTTGAPVVFRVDGKETVGLFTGRTTNVPGQTGIGSELYAFQLP
jgi:glucose dehydrogenase